MNSSKNLVNQHRKKKHVFKERESPFPVPIASITREVSNRNYWHHYTGQLQGDTVIVTHSGDISYLQRMGFFGKGMMSRGAPSMYKNLPYVHLPSTKDGEPDVMHIMRRRMYLKHMKWKKSHDKRLTNQGAPDVDITAISSEDEEYDSDIDFTQTGYDHEAMNSNFPQLESGHTFNSSSVKDNLPQCSDVTNVAWQQSPTNQNSSIWSLNENSSKQEVRDESWENQLTTENAATDSWDNMEADEDFWATNDVPDEKSESKENNLCDSNETALSNFENCDTQINEKKRVHSNELMDTTTKKLKLTKDEHIMGNSEDNEEVKTKDSVSQINSSVPNMNNSEENTDIFKNEITEIKVIQEDRVHAGHEIDNILVLERTKSETGKKEATENVGEVASNERVENIDKCDHSGDKFDNSHSDNTEMEINQPEPLPIHPYCKDDDEEENDDDDDGDMLDDENDSIVNAVDEFLVIDDSDIDDSTFIVPKKDKYTWLPVKKKEIFNFNEPLMLSLEEAYFLSYGLGCLTVKDESNSILSLTDMWCRFCEKKQFLPRYVAYHYFRSKGWVPKPTILFGTDLLVYKVGPQFYHASYSVIVRTVYEGTFEEVEDYNTGKISWTGFFGINRVTEQVAKTLVYCYVIMPKDLSEEEKKSPDCIARFKIRLQSVQRWVSSQERDKEKIADDDPVT